MTILLAATAAAQDRRTVVEPTIPAACTTLTATLLAVGDSTIAEADERKVVTDQIQNAIDHCGAGKAVVLAAGEGARTVFLTGPLTLRANVALVVGARAILLASRDPKLYDIDGRCGTVDKKGHGCKPLITAENVAHSGVMGPGTIEGRGWAKLLGKDVSWWDLAQQAKVEKLNQSCPRLMQLTRADDFTLYRITIRNSPNFHVVYDRGNGFTAWGVVINTPGLNARNTDGIDPASATNVTITHSFINTGDDDVAIKAGSTGKSTNMTISHNHFFRGHGMSIGSETDGTASAIRVFDLSIDGADNGLRIKSNASRGGLVQDVEYKDVCLRRVKHPIEMDTHYSASEETTGNKIPEFRDIRLQNVRVEQGGDIILDGYDSARPLRMAWDNVTFDTPASFKVKASFLELTQGPGPMNLPIRGERVKVTGTASEAPGNACAGKFVAMPATVAVAPVGAAQYSAIVDGKFTGKDGAMVGGVATFRTIGSALENLPQNGIGRTAIFIRNGRYHEKLTVERPYVTLRGESRDGTILTYDAAAGAPSPGGGTYGTRGSYTLRIVAPDFRAENITIENAFDYLANAAKSDSDVTKMKGSQGVALMTDMDADRSVFSNVKLLGHQDTLFPNAGRSYFYKSEIWGSVDFIFGAGKAVFDDCDIISRDRGSKTNNGYITAPSTLASQPYGLLFIHSRFKKERAEMPANSVTLGRPWHPFANPVINSSAVFIDNWMDNHIGEKGWDRMSSVDSTGTRTWYEPADARFFEFGTKGPGAVVSASRKTLTAIDASRYTPANVLDGWVPAH
ncbi:MAG: endo-polygalacturonase/pectinesterase [Gemmatimonadetes bacterium]|nr:endo-polygalacturonase/pectinesterase [Gemmatimonadota bacterium]